MPTYQHASTASALTREGRAFQRVLVMLVAMLSAALQLGSAAHFVLVRHTVCSEHGELVHAGEAHAGSHAGLPSAGDDPTLDEAAAVDEGHEHDHCVTSDARQASLSFSRCVLWPEAARALPADADPPARCDAAERLPSARILLFAPKNSPPSVAGFSARPVA